MLFRRTACAPALVPLSEADFDAAKQGSWRLVLWAIGLLGGSLLLGLVVADMVTTWRAFASVRLASIVAFLGSLGCLLGSLRTVRQYSVFSLVGYEPPDLVFGLNLRHRDPKVGEFLATVEAQQRLLTKREGLQLMRYARWVWRTKQESV
jgi:hypothetical protein